jgi:LPS-assembly protein
MDYEKVSDDSYFSNLSSQVNLTSQVNLARQANLRYNGGWWQASGLAQTFQTLQDPSAALVVEPYSRLPQVTLTASRDLNWGNKGVDQGAIAPGMRFDFSSDLVYFDHPGDSRVQGARVHANPSLSFPIQTPYSVVTPRLGWYLSHYALDDSTLNKPDSLGNTGFADTSRSLPMFSLDSSLVLERDLKLLSKNYTQTLEPRAYYVYIPYKDQSQIPVFDSSSRDLSLDQLFGENQFIGVDRINDANQLTLAVTSRVLDSDSGAERLQVTLGQRYYFTDQQVTLSGPAKAAKSTELLAQASGQINARLRLNAGIQVDTGERELTKANLGGAWRYGPGRLVNADYRYTRDSLDQIDVSFQWPLAPKWFGLGRLNYSIRESSLVEGLIGFEYNPGCWSLRGVMQQLATTEATSTSAFFLQLELRGLTKLGPNPLDVLKRSITGYVQSSEIPE